MHLLSIQCIIDFLFTPSFVSDDPDGIYHHARKVLTLITADIRVFSYECKDAVCFQNLLVQTIDTIQTFMTSGRFTLAVYEWSRNRGPPIEQLWLAEMDKSSWAQTSSHNPFITASSSQVGLKVTTPARCEIQNVDWSNDVSTDSITSNLNNITKTALYDLTEDDRFVRAGMVVEQSLAVQFTNICEEDFDNFQDTVQCSNTNPATIDFSIVLYLPYYAATDGLSTIMEEQLNSITAYHEGSYHISSCSLGESDVYSFALYYPDWFKYRSCINDGEKNYLS